MKKAIKYLVSLVITLALCHYVFLPGLESSNDYVKTLTLGLLIFTVIWALFIFPKNK